MKKNLIIFLYFTCNAFDWYCMYLLMDAHTRFSSSTFLPCASMYSANDDIFVSPRRNFRTRERSRLEVIFRRSTLVHYHLGIYAGMFLSVRESLDLPPQSYPDCLRRGLSTLVACETFNTQWYRTRRASVVNKK